MKGEIKCLKQETAVNDEIEKFDTEKTEHDEAKNKLSSDIADLEGQLEEIERNAPQPNKPEETNTKKTRGDYNMEKIEIRSLPLLTRSRWNSAKRSLHRMM